MTMTAHEIFGGTIQKTDEWLHAVQSALEWDDPRGAYLALRATLHALRDRLPVNEAVDLGAQLPMLIRGLFYEDWRPSGKPLKERHKDEFLGHIRHEFRRDGASIDAEQVARAVFQILARQVTAGEIRHVRRVLPHEIDALWP